ncbi:MAG: hypothetical protein ACP5E9_07635 [Candidatus Methanospirareceae archaeon]
MTKTKTLHAVFDGKVLKPEGSVDLETGKRYVLVIESDQELSAVEEDPAFDVASLAVKTNIADLATEHDHYLYGRARGRSST